MNLAPFCKFTMALISCVRHEFCSMYLFFDYVGCWVLGVGCQPMMYCYIIVRQKIMSTHIFMSSGDDD